MGVTRWADIQDKVSPERRAEIKREAVAELDRVGYAALRKARELTQVELAERLGIAQSSVAALEARMDVQLSTLAKYIRAMGGELEIRAVFPEATFNLEPPAAAVSPVVSGTTEPSSGATAISQSVGAKGDVARGSVKATKRTRRNAA